MLPLIKSYEKKSFLRESEIILKFLKRSSLKSVNTFEDKFWIYASGKPKTKKKKRHLWMPKLYICVQPEHYWSVVADLISITNKFKMEWKFSSDLKFFSRPDKIVIYADTSEELKKLIKIIRPRLQGKTFHSLNFAASTTEMKFEKKHKGMYVGADPTFLKHVSWRLFRWGVNEGLIKPNLKNGLDKNTRDALNALNISVKHLGPKSLAPKSTNIKFIAEVWKAIH